MAEVEQVQPEDDEIAEEWVRMTDEPDVLGAGAWRPGGTVGSESWRVNLHAAELVREEPLESEMRQRMRQELMAVPGVRAVFEEDREQWLCDGDPSGEALVSAAAGVANAIADRVRASLPSIADRNRRFVTRSHRDPPAG